MVNRKLVALFLNEPEVRPETETNIKIAGQWDVGRNPVAVGVQVYIHYIDNDARGSSKHEGSILI